MSDEHTITLYRPVGTKELELIQDCGFEAFPPRLSDQPIFYPVLNEQYAIQIARDWNAKLNDDKIGYVTRFAVRKTFLDAFETHVVGSGEHESIGFQLIVWRSSIRISSAQ